jgi:DNA-binding SARP family transcriptional activator
VADWEYGLLGPLEVRVDDRAVPLASARQRLVLVMLLLAAGQLVPAARLIDELWGESLPADPPAALRTQVSRLRRALGPAGASLVTASGGYRLSLRRDQLDAARFEDALAAAADADGERAARILDEALEEWRGPALAEFADRPFARPEAFRLDELRVAARERRAEIAVSLGAAEDAVAALRAVVADHPERERARGLLMRALYQSGRHTDALATFRSWRRYLSEDPSFVGREDDRLAVTGLLGEVRLLTLHGPGGVGKTRLALEVINGIGARYAGGVRFCDLTAITAPVAVTRAIASAAGFSERAFRRLDDQLIEYLASRQGRSPPQAIPAGHGSTWSGRLPWRPPRAAAWSWGWPRSPWPHCMPVVATPPPRSTTTSG